MTGDEIRPEKTNREESIQNLLIDPTVTEILIQSAQNIWVEKLGRLSQTAQTFASDLDYHNFLQELFIEARMRPDLETPHADGVWRGFRVHFVQPPLSPQGPLLSLRKKSPTSWSLNDLSMRNWAPPSAIQEIEKMIFEKKTLLIAGATGTGKTSVLNACLKSVANNERVIAIEDTDEIHLPNSVSAKLLTRATDNLALPTYSQTDLVKQSLRMRPDRLVMGEVRGGEAKDLLLAFSSGHCGGFATLHAESARQALMRLEMLVQMGAPQWSLQTVRSLIQTGFAAILIVERKNEMRRLASIAKITALEDSGFCLEKIYSSH